MDYEFSKISGKVLTNTLKIIIQLTLAHIRMTYTTTKKNLLYNTIQPIIRHYMCIDRDKRNNQLRHNDITENSQ
jgi:hypothetical protein